MYWPFAKIYPSQAALLFLGNINFFTAFPTRSSTNDDLAFWRFQRTGPIFSVKCLFQDLGCGIAIFQDVEA
jgi:hypothetical protein